MKKIPTLFLRDPSNRRLVIDEVTPGCEWVVNGEGVATVKLDGSCCRIWNSTLWKRHEVKPGRSAPEKFVASGDPDPTTGKQVGWVLVDITDPANQWHVEALNNSSFRRDATVDGTYELLGPKINGNPERVPCHVLVEHGSKIIRSAPTRFDLLSAFLECNNIEGIVWWHPANTDLLAKIKGRDFGHKRDPEGRRLWTWESGSTE